MKVKEIYRFIDGFAPFCGAESWDNSGLQAGDPEADVSGILLCLDVTETEIEAAVRCGANLILSHHPLLFHPLRFVASDSVAASCIRNHLNVLSAHTNLDRAVGGVNDCLCEALSMTYQKTDPAVASGFLNVGVVSGVHTVEDLAVHIREKLNAPVRFVPAKKDYTKIAVCSGAGCDFLEDALFLGCDAYITGDAAYHDFLTATQMGVTLFAAGHFETENMFVFGLQKKLADAFPGLKIIFSPRRAPIRTLN